jgi:hypothetical protein
MQWTSRDEQEKGLIHPCDPKRKGQRWNYRRSRVGGTLRDRIAGSRQDRGHISIPASMWRARRRNGRRKQRDWIWGRGGRNVLVGAAVPLHPYEFFRGGAHPSAAPRQDRRAAMPSSLRARASRVGWRSPRRSRLWSRTDSVQCQTPAACTGRAGQTKKEGAALLAGTRTQLNVIAFGNGAETLSICPHHS